MSWIIINRETGKTVAEFYSQAIVDKINTKKYQALPALEYLQGLNMGAGECWKPRKN